jgi:hypothetical protein
MSSATSQLPSLVTLANTDLLMVVVSPSTAPANKKVTIWQLLGMLPANTHFLARITAQGNATFNGTGNLFTGNTSIQGIATVRNLTVANNYVTISTAHATPANTTATSVTRGAIFWDSNYIYVATADNTVKRAALSTF